MTVTPGIIVKIYTNPDPGIDSYFLLQGDKELIPLLRETHTYIQQTTHRERIKQTRM